MVRSNIPSAPYNAAILAGVTSSAGELNYNDITTAGTVQASKAVIADTNKDVTGFRDVTLTRDLTVGDDVVATGDVSGATGTFVDLTPSAYAAVARTATSDGLTTGIIAAAGSYQLIAVTSSSANNIIVLPTPTPGTIIDLLVGANGYELRSSAPSTVLIGGGTGGAAVESAIAANTWARIVCVDATHWVGFTITGATLAAIEAAA